MTIKQYIEQNPDASDAEIVALHNAQAPAPRPGPVWITYLWLGEARELFGDNAPNVSGAMRSDLAEWINSTDLSTINAALPNKGVLRSIHSRLDGSPGIDLTSASTPGMLQLFASGVPGVVSPILTAEHAAALLNLGYVVPDPVTEEDVATVRAELTRRTNADTATAASYQASALAQALNERHVSHGDVQPVTLTLPTIPEGFEYKAGRIQPVEG